MAEFKEARFSIPEISRGAQISSGELIVWKNLGKSATLLRMKLRQSMSWESQLMGSQMLLLRQER